jgi:microcystin-dependent protein
MTFDPEDKVSMDELAPSLQNTINDKATKEELNAHVGHGGEVQHPIANETLAGFLSPALYNQLIDLIKNGGTSGGSTGISGFKKGMILEWGYDKGTIPNGFQLCDGTNGTPDLRDKFVPCAGGKYQVGDTGGEEKHTLSSNETPSSINSDLYGVNFAHGYQENSNPDPDYFYNKGTPTNNADFSITGSGMIPMNGAPPLVTHTSSSIDIPIEQQTTNIIEFTKLNSSSSAASPHENRPPFYALCYIMCMVDDNSYNLLKGELDTHIGFNGVKQHALVDSNNAGFMSPDMLAKLNAGSGCVLIKGTAANGTTIPLPNGFTENQCIWGTYGGEFNVGTNKYTDCNYPTLLPDSTYNSDGDYIVCIRSDRVVVAAAEYEIGGGSDSNGSKSVEVGSAYYWILGVK